MLGNVLQAANGQNPGRRAALAGGIARQTPGITVNDVCLASLSAVGLAAGMLREGEATTVLVGGFDSMTGAPHAVHVRTAGPLGDEPMIDVMVHDGLYCSIQDVGMGELSDAENARLGISRADQDAFAAESHARAAAARDPPGRGDRPARRAHRGRGRPARHERRAPRLLTCCVYARGHDHGGQRLPALGWRRRRDPDHGRERAQRGRPRAARRGGRASRGRRPRLLPPPAPRGSGGQAPRARRPASQETSTCGRSTRRSPASPWRAPAPSRSTPSKVNVNGGAVALGHPLAASGFRLLLTLAHQMRRDGATLGVATMCGGGGQGEAVLLRRS